MLMMINEIIHVIFEVDSIGDFYLSGFCNLWLAMEL